MKYNVKNQILIEKNGDLLGYQTIKVGSSSSQLVKQQFTKKLLFFYTHKMPVWRLNMKQEQCKSIKSMPDSEFVSGSNSRI